jgi:hypothetical protein
MTALNVECCRLVGELGIQAEARCLTCNPRRVERSVLIEVVVVTIPPRMLNVCRYTH